MTRIIGQLCREWPVLLDERGHGCCARATPLLRGHVLAQPRGLARFTPGVAIAVGQILVIVRGRGPLVDAVTLTLGWAERIQDGIEGGDHRVRGQDVEDGQHRHGGLGETSGARCLLRMVISKDVVEKRLGDVGELGGVDGLGRIQERHNSAEDRQAMVTESAP